MRSITILLIAGVALTACQTGGFSNPFARRPQPPASFEPAPAGAYPPPSPSGAGLPMASSQRFADLPLPANLKADPDRTFVYQSGNFAVGRMVYTTRAQVNELAQFYIDEAPAADWRLQSMTEGDDKELVFLKPGRKLVVRVRDEGIRVGRRLILDYTPDGGGL